MSICTFLQASAEGRTSYKLFINEIQVSNIDLFLDPSYNYGGWIELYNSSNKSVSLSKKVLRHIDSKGKVLEQILSSAHGIIEPKGFCVLWFDHNSKDGFYGPNARFQIPFKLDPDGGKIEIIDKNGFLVDAIEYPTSISRCSYMRINDGVSSWEYTSYPSPGASNNLSPVASKRLVAPLVDTNGKVFDAPFQFKVFIPEGCTLYYTTDGSTPQKDPKQKSEDGVFYLSNESKIYRFMLSADKYLDSPVVTRTFIKASRNYYLPILSVSTHPDNLYNDSIGLYVRGTNGRIANNSGTPANQNMDWERPVNVDYLVPDKNGNYIQYLNQEAEFSIFGGLSRFLGGDSVFECKPSFKLKANKSFEGMTHFPHPIFSNKPHIRLKSFLVRNGGQDPKSRFWDPAIQELVRTSDIYIDCQSWQPAHVFLNGTYLGMMNLREESNRRFAYSNYGIDSDEIDQWENEFDMKSGDTKKIDRWYKLSRHLASNPNDSSIWQEICRLVDIDEYCNYMAIETYTGNYDWLLNNHLKNIKGFCARNDNGRIHHVLFDMDETFGETDLINKILYGENEKQLQIFTNMLKYKPFREQYIDAFCLVGGSVFNPDRCKPILLKMANKTTPALKWEGYESISRAKDLISRISDRKNRYPALMNSLKMAFNLPEGNYAHISSNLSSGKIQLNGQEIPTGQFEGILFAPSKLTALSPAGYIFKEWKMNGTSIGSDSILTIDSLFAGDVISLQAVFKPNEKNMRPNVGTAHIFINEISSRNDLYVNEFDNKSCWVELFNPTNRDIDLAGMFISNDRNNLKKYKIPSVNDKSVTIIPAHGHCIIWCDGRETTSQIHAPFRLSNTDGSCFILQTADASWTDSLVYCQQPRWTSFGRYPDGANHTCLFNRPTIGTSNFLCTFNSENFCYNTDYQETIKGDANKDGIVDISDVLTIVDHVLGKRNTTFDYVNSDVNDDGLIDIIDVMCVLDIILNHH